MPGIMHKTMGEASWNSLSPSDRKEWRLTYSFPANSPYFISGYAPAPKSLAEKIGIYCLSLDLMGWQSALWQDAPEFLLSDGKPVPHGLADADCRLCMTNFKWRDQSATRRVLREFLGKALDSYIDGKHERAALFIGVVAHFIQDATAVGHMFPNSLFYELSPKETGRHFDYHSMFDAVSPEMMPPAPEILGGNMAELVFQSANLIELNFQHAERNLFALLEACRDGDKEKLNTLMRLAYERSVYNLASIFKTIPVLSKVENPPVAKWNLTGIIPYNFHPGGQYRTPGIDCNIVDGKRVRLHLNGKRIDKGIGMTPFCSIRYLLEPEAFTEFSGIVGLSSECRQDQNSEMDVDFFVALDDNYNQEISGELDYGPTMRKVFSCRFIPESEPVDFKIDLGNARTLCIGVISRPSVNGKNFFPHIVTGNLSLRRN